MGRRKIEIKAIKDDRNRSVTFLKRKGGLFKKAHELSVLCSVDVAVIIFGNNKKLYEYSSSDIGEILQRYNYYGAPNEHKGPTDFNGKGALDDDEDDDDNIGSPNSPHSQEPPMMPPQFQNQPAFQHIRHQTASASPPIPNGAPFHHVQRGHTPQPQMGSRPASRNALQRSGSGLPPHMAQQSQPPPPVNGYTYMAQPTIYNAPNGPGMPGHPNSQTLPQQPQYQYSGLPPQQHQLQQIYVEEQRRSSMPPSFPQQDRSSVPANTPPQPQHQQLPSQGQLPQEPPLQQMPSQQQIKQEYQQQQHHQQQQQQQQQQMQQPPPPPPQQQQQLQQQSHPSQGSRLGEPVKRLSVKSRSIFTPIDETRSILSQISQHWASSTSAAETVKIENTPNRPQSVDSASMSRENGPGLSPPPPPRSQTQTQGQKHGRNTSLSSLSDAFTPPSRTNSAQLGAKRPRLKVQIPEEHSDGGSATGGSSPHGSDATGANPARKSGTDGSHSSGVVLPPPSPSASALLSAGASGPPNPFARPHPPSQASQSNTNTIDTPVSALPSRFMNNEFLPSPSSFYPEWNFRGSDSNTLPSPLNFATPILGTGPSFLREDSGPSKRKSPDLEDLGGGDSKRAKLED